MTFARRCVTAAVALVVAGIVMVMSASPVWAHIELAESDPANFSTVDQPVEVVRLTFSGPAEAVSDQFGIEDPGGNAVGIVSIEPEGDGSTLAVTPAQPLAGGRHRVSWAIRSGDSHTMTGTVAITVTAPAVAAVDGAGATPPSTIATTARPDADPASATQNAERVATLARWLVYTALLFCVGGLGYLAWVHRGSAAEGRRLVFLVRRAALIVAGAAVVEFLAQVVVFEGGSISALMSPSAWGEVLTAGFGTGTALRLIGAGLVLAFLRIDLDDTFVLEGDGGFDELSASDFALLDESGPGGLATRLQATAPPLVRLRVEASPIAFVGAFLLVASEAFIGHTATIEPRLLVIMSDAGHLVAAGLWAAGAVMLAVTIGRRHRRNQPLDARLLATRFSVVAGWSLVAVAVTGTILAWEIMGGVDGLWTTTFGKVLVAKVVAVAVIAALGAYNHKVLVPALSNGDADADHQFRRTVTVEAALFGVVLALTAVLVASSAV